MDGIVLERGRAGREEINENLNLNFGNIDITGVAILCGNIMPLAV